MGQHILEKMIVEFFDWSYNLSEAEQFPMTDTWMSSPFSS